MESKNIEQSDPKDKESWSDLLKTDSLGKMSAVFLGIIYLCGFLTLNSHLYKYGIIELGIANTEYLVAGAVFILYLAIYGVFAGRAIVMSKQWLGDHIAHLREVGAPAISPHIAFAHMFIELTFFHCLSAALFSTFAFGQIENVGFYAVLSFVFIVSYAFDTSNWDTRHPFAHLIIDAALKIVAVFSFFILSTGDNLDTVFIAFAGYSMYINLVLDSFDRHRITKDRIVFNIGYAAIFFLLAALTFGSSVYGKVSKKIGGGKPLEMAIGLKPDSLEKHPGEIKSPMTGEVVYITRDTVYIKTKESTLIIPRHSVKWMSFQDDADNDEFLDLHKRLKGEKE